MYLWPLGGLAVGYGGNTFSDRVYIACMGPATAVPLSFFWMCAVLVFNDGQLRLSMSGLRLDSPDWFLFLCIVQLIGQLVNFAVNALVPCFPLDGSQILVNYLAGKQFEPERIAIWLVNCSIPPILAMCIYLLYLLFLTPSFSMLLWVGAMLISPGFCAYSLSLIHI
eukprot:TRINITY_DN16909_c0_g1_i1.p1 TRINITY_DN16909_c0_g1~~TRINITY_DN16909_c0_g1_i1.p1  ORF type:complete len:167 (-),score=26.17 TRINITY_DN16909_c0_g1_i1:153-653(-)